MLSLPSLPSFPALPSLASFPPLPPLPSLPSLPSLPLPKAFPPSSSSSLLSLPLFPRLPLPDRRLERLRLLPKSRPEVSLSSKIESRMFGLGSASTGFSSAAGIDGGGASVTPLVIHDGIVVPRPRPAGPAGPRASSGAADDSALSEVPAVIQAGTAAAFPRPAGPRTGDGSLGVSFTLALLGLLSPSPSSSPSSSSSSSSSSVGGFHVTEMVLAPVLPLSSISSLLPRSRSRRPLPPFRRPLPRLSPSLSLSLWRPLLPPPPSSSPPPLLLPLSLSLAPKRPTRSRLRPPPRRSPSPSSSSAHHFVVSDSLTSSTSSMPCWFKAVRIESLCGFMNQASRAWSIALSFCFSARAILMRRVWNTGPVRHDTSWFDSCRASALEHLDNIPTWLMTPSRSVGSSGRPPPRAC
mmetsp:Transcript_30974/g.67948  ORF Transcript_30974/g.67948 Transcript_30974/m.67948 type:complete len:409 (-) Transcript_30974:706-1932(-)